ncbi:MAG TPA: c-type cytochrome [Steroidobacteraceae bacterium]|nr:c-type cytochrome [Steroidobacteraceae bacterium]
MNPNSQQAGHGGRIRRRAISILIAAAGLVTLQAHAGPGDEPDRATGYARNLAVGVCGTCHGPGGNSVQPKFPRLAGQNAAYLAAQLKSFRSQTRGDPDAIGYMWGMAGELSDETIEALATYYSGQKPLSAGHPAQASRGREIYERGIQAEGVPACIACHGADAHGTGIFPRLAGQHAQYVLKQLGSFQTNMRNVAVMHGIAQNLRLSEMREVAAYLESLP